MELVRSISIYVSLSMIHFFFKDLFIYSFNLLTVGGLCCCMRAFSSCREQELLFAVVRGFLIVVASLVEHGL